MHTRLFIPGPTEVSPEILSVMSTPMIGHRSKEYEELHSRVYPKLQKLFYTKNLVFLGTCSSTGWMEGAIRNCVEKRCLNLACGDFGTRWHTITKKNGIPCDLYSVEWGEPILPQTVDKLLSTGKYDAVTLVHNETSTGVMNPLEEISEVMKKYPNVIFLLDAVSSLGGVKIEVDRLGIDVCFAGVQKALALPPGLAICSVSEKALNKSKKIKNKGYYFDFEVYLKYHEKNQTPTTPPISLIFALDRQLDIIFEEGLEKRFERHLKMAKITRKWAEENFALFPKKGYESVTMTTLKNTRNIDIAKLNSELAKKGAVISNGYGKIKNKTFRIAHMGDTTVEELQQLLNWIDEIVKYL